jgi:acyl-CoA thioesterase-1
MKTFLTSLILFLLTIAKVQANTIVILGDSLSSAYGFEREKGWVVLLQKHLQAENFCSQIVNLSTSGDTSSNGLSKLRRYFKKNTASSVVIQLGGNDALRGIPLQNTEKNLQAMIDLCRENNAGVLLLATRLPPNYGPFFLAKFKKLYQRLAEKNHLVLEPSMLKGVAGHAKLMQADGLHPRAAAQSIIAQHLWPYFKPLLEPCSG